ncbi:hypothetical protein [Winogradskyella sp. A3E31]|uniref:hypothetical protein n=1 Tax=Winogradskyella sp. A3E31 TaxID=3349637 RepID=UPI00398B9901
MKFSYYIIILQLLNGFMAVGQEDKGLHILVADSTWGKEIIPFPIDWAPKVTLSGFEELRFAPNWSKPESDTFWSLVMAWKVDMDEPLSSKDVGVNIKGYFDGLMKPNHWATKFPDPEVSLLETDTELSYTGSMKLFDGFYTGKVIQLNFEAKQFWCPRLKQSVLIIWCSPQERSHKIWQKLKEVYVQTDFCSN